MKKFYKFCAALFVFLTFSVVSYASKNDKHVSSPAVALDANCAYKLEDVKSGLKDYIILGFVTHETSKDGNIVLGSIVYHNPKNPDKTSEDAAQLVFVYKKENKEATLAVMYVGKNADVVYRRERLDNGSPGPCFTREVVSKDKK